MSAKNGSTLSVRKLIGICLSLAIVAAALLATSASAKTTLKPTNYVALGDSISFGYSEEKFDKNYPTEPISAFEGGFVNILGAKLASLEKKSGNGLKTYNLSCPGELSDGLIGENAALGGGGKNADGSDDAPCGWHNTDGFARHTEYGSVSQLEGAIGILETPAYINGETKYVTMQIGSNDELAAVAKCEEPSWLEARSMKGLDECLTVEAEEGKTGEETFEGEKLTGEKFYEDGLFHHIIANVGDTIGVLRHFGFAGEVAVLGFYNPEAIVLPGSDAIQKKLNEVFEYEIGASAFGPGVVYANPFPKFNPQKGNAKEQAAICKYTEYCNEFDKEQNLKKHLEEEGYGEAEAQAYAEAHHSEYPVGDIHPTLAGHKWLAKILYTALTTGKTVE
jgi:hypothetical protein